MDKKFDALGFGEMLLRLSPLGKEKLSRGEGLEKRAGGSELNVAAGISALGLNSALISKLPDNPISHFIMAQMRAHGVADDYIVLDQNRDSRVGLYYYESATSPRKPSVVYDRKGSAINQIKLDEIPGNIYANTRLFHTSGITLALGDSTCETAIEMMKHFKNAGALLSFDVNYRANLWSEEKARVTIERILPLLDILFISEETSRRMFHKTGELRQIMKTYATDYGISVVATSERKVISSSRHGFGSTIYSAKDDHFYHEPSYEEIEVVDRIGSGDAYVAGVLFGLLNFKDMQRALEFGNAMAAVKSTIPGDLIVTNYREIEEIITAHHSLEPQSEMNR